MFFPLISFQIGKVPYSALVHYRTIAVMAHTSIPVRKVKRLSSPAYLSFETRFLYVIPAKAGIQAPSSFDFFLLNVHGILDSHFHGNDNCEFFAFYAVCLKFLILTHNLKISYTAPSRHTALWWRRYRGHYSGRYRGIVSRRKASSHHPRPHPRLWD